MTCDDIMALANQTAGQHWMDEAHIQRFAALVAAAEREACLQLCVASKLIASSSVVETEAINQCAAAIRARSNP